MNRYISILMMAVAVMTAGTSCIKEKLETTYTNQENKIDQYINSNKYTDSSKTDSLRVVYNGGSSRLVMTEGTGEELNSHGTVAFYYAGYVFNGNKKNEKHNYRIKNRN